MTDLRQRIGRLAYMGIVAGLAAGVFFGLMGQSAASIVMLAATCGVLITLPIVNILFVTADEIRRRDWMFALMGAGVLALVGASLAVKLLS